MNSLRPLLFLSTRSLFNTLRRAITSPRRLIVVGAMVLYYFTIFIRPALIPSQSPNLPPGVGQIPFPPLEILDAFAFAVFLGISLLMMLGMMSYQGSFRPPDVDMLFPTPVSPKAVLGFRMLRDYLVTLLLPFFIAILSLRGAKRGWTEIFRNMPHPEYSGYTLRAMTLSWILMAMCWISLSYAISLWINRSDTRSDRNKQYFTTFLGIWILGSIAYIGWRLYTLPAGNVKELITVAQSPILRVLFFTASFATKFTLAPLQGSLASAMVGIGGLVATICIGLSLTLKQVGWLYDQAAARGFAASKARALQRSGDYMGIAAERARARAGRARTIKTSFFHRLKMRGPWALVWKELFLQPRAVLGMLVVLLLVGVSFSLVPAMMPINRDIKEAGFLLLFMQGMAVMLVTLVLAQTGFIEVLKRVDLQKPLPFSPMTIAAFEIGAKSILPMLCCGVGAVVAWLINPHLWLYCVAALIFSPGLSLLLGSTVFCVIMFFPDVEDPTQRQFRGLITLLGAVFTGFLPVLTFAGLMFLSLSAPLAAALGSLVAFGVSALLCYLSGQLYANFNPAE